MDAARLIVALGLILAFVGIAVSLGTYRNQRLSIVLLVMSFVAFCGAFYLYYRDHQRDVHATWAAIRERPGWWIIVVIVLAVALWVFWQDIGPSVGRARAQLMRSVARIPYRIVRMDRAPVSAGTTAVTAQVARRQSDAALSEGDYVRIEADVPAWASQLLVVLRSSHEALRQVVVEFWGASSPEGKSEYRALEDAEQRLVGALQHGARHDVVVEAATAYYRGYFDYVAKVHWHVRDQGQRDRVILLPAYIGWERRDDDLQEFVSKTTASGPINTFHAAVKTQGQIERL